MFQAVLAGSRSTARRTRDTGTLSAWAISRWTSQFWSRVLTRAYRAATFWGSSFIRLFSLILDNTHLLLEQAHGLTPVVENSRGAKATIHERAVCLRQEHRDFMLADRAVSDADLTQSRLKSDLFGLILSRFVLRLGVD